eukprot:Gb_23577 [translate_table: standard]
MYFTLVEAFRGKSREAEGAYLCSNSYKKAMVVLTATMSLPACTAYSSVCITKMDQQGSAERVLGHLSIVVCLAMLLDHWFLGMPSLPLRYHIIESLRLGVKSSSSFGSVVVTSSIPMDDGITVGGRFHWENWARELEI